jgi:non-specific serine/threonine protein kinase
VAAAAGQDRWDVQDGQTALVGQSLLAEEEGADQTSRYRLLETMRAYARQHLTAGQRTRLARAHARFYAAVAERAGPEMYGPAQLGWLRQIRAERDNLHAAVTWALARGGHDPRLAFRIVTALLALEELAPVIIRGWADACLTRLDACPPELRAPVLTAAAFSAITAADVPLARRLAEQALAEPAPGDPLTSWWTRAGIATIYENTQPERGVSLACELREEAAERGIEYQVGYSLTIEAGSLNLAGDHAAARQPAMEAVEIARRIRNPRGWRPPPSPPQRRSGAASHRPRCCSSRTAWR